MAEWKPKAIVRERERACDQCGATACYGLTAPAVPTYAEVWRCAPHVLPGFLPRDRSPR